MKTLLAVTLISLLFLGGAIGVSASDQVLRLNPSPEDTEEESTVVDPASNGNIQVTLTPRSVHAEVEEEVTYVITVKDTRDTVRPLVYDPTEYFLQLTYAQISEDHGFSQEDTVASFAGSGATNVAPPHRIIEEKFSKNSVLLDYGESDEVEMTVVSHLKGAYTLEVRILSVDEHNERIYHGSGSAQLSVGGGLTDPIGSEFFVGEGFVIERDNVGGSALKLSLLRDGRSSALRGRLFIFGMNYPVEGSVVGDTVKFTVVPQIPEGIPDNMDVSLHEGTFTGSLRSFDGKGSFDLLTGELLFNSRMYDLTAFSHGGRVHPIEVLPSKPERLTDVGVGEIVSFARTAEASAARAVGSLDSAPTDASAVTSALRPLKVREKRFLWIFPTGEKVLDAEVILDGKWRKVTFEEGASQNVGDYTVRVGNLDHPEDLTFDVSLAA